MSGNNPIILLYHQVSPEDTKFIENYNSTALHCYESPIGAQLILDSPCDHAVWSDHQPGYYPAQQSFNCLLVTTGPGLPFIIHF